MTRSAGNPPQAQDRLRPLVKGALRGLAAACAHRHPAEAVTTLVFAPHPDDETLGCGGLIADRAAAGATVALATLTDGSASHQGLIDGRELAALRHAEALAAAHELGVPADRCHFLGLPDHDLASHHDAAVAGVAALLATYQPGEVYVPHRDDGLADHRATHDIVCAALATHPHALRLYAYPVWLWHTWPWVAGRHLDGTRRVPARLLADNWQLVLGCRSHHRIGLPARKQRALACYRTQMERRPGAARWPVLGDVAGGEFLGCFAGPFEVFAARLHPAHTGHG